MNIKEIINVIESFAPLETQELWDCSGFQIDAGTKEVKKILLCLSVTENIIKQAVEKDCDLIIAHHPLFFIPFDFKKGISPKGISTKAISIYSAHTNLDKTQGGTTDTLIDLLDFPESEKIGDFLRFTILEKEISLNEFVSLLKTKLNLENIRVVNNFNQTKIKKIAFCAGSGAEFLDEAKKFRADSFVTGDVKYHTALDSDIITIDIGHFESEYPVLKTIEKLLKPLKLKVMIADEKSPFINF